MDLRIRADVAAAPVAVHAVVDDLGTYRRWLGIVRAAEIDTAAPGDTGPAWRVHLGARIGLLPMTKSVRMVRLPDQPAGHVRFERAELDGRAHSRWDLDVTVAELPGSGSSVAVHLHYGGSGWAQLLEPLLRAEAARAAGRLAAILT